MSLHVSRRTDPSALDRPAPVPDVAAATARRRRLPEVPRPMVVLWAAVALTGVAIVALGAWSTGVSWDESYHVERMRNYLDSGWYLLDGDLLGDEPGPWEDQRHVYGPVTMVLLHGWSMLWGVDGASGVPATAEAYAVRHLGVALIAMIGVAAAAAVTRVLLHRWTWGLATGTVLLALPVWSGHAMFNVKDVPVATGYTLATLGLAVLVCRSTTARPVLATAGGAATLAAGVVLAVGTRPGIWPGIALSVLVALVTRDRRRVAAVAGALVAAYGALLAVYPQVFASPGAALVGAATESSRFGGVKGEWWYLPLFVLVEIPTGLLLLGLLAAAWSVRRLWQRRSRLADRDVVLVLVGLQCFAIPVLAMARESNIYNGVRQMLFAAPALAILVTVAAATLLAAWSRWPAGWRRRLLPLALAVTVLVPVSAQLTLFPYSYAHSTVLANLAAPVVERISDHEVPTDYWRTSVRELAPDVPADGWVVCSPATIGDDQFAVHSREGHDDCATKLVGPLAAYNGLRTLARDASPTRFLVVETNTTRVASNCTELADVSRWLYWRRVTMSYVADCELVLPPFPDSGALDLDGGGARGDHLIGGWAIHPADPGIGVRDTTAELGFALPDLDPGATVRLTGTALGATGMSVRVNGAPVDVRVERDERDEHRDTFAVDVPGDSVAAYGAGRVVVAFGDADRDLRLLSLTVDTDGDRP